MTYKFAAASLSALALALCWPVMIGCAIAVKVTSKGPALFIQKRHGFNNEIINVLKFRSMYTEMSDPTAKNAVTKGDPRVTRVGRFIRKTSLDELPQLLNVIAGEMSLVGPRPHAIGMKTGETESALLVAEYAHRHRIKPGMTGWAAVNGSRGPLHTAQDVRRRVRLDIDYVERQSLWLDLWIMAVTVPVLTAECVPKLTEPKGTPVTCEELPDTMQPLTTEAFTAKEGLVGAVAAIAASDVHSNGSAN